MCVPSTFPLPSTDVLDWARWSLHLKFDAALAGLLAVAPPTLSRIRHATLPLGPGLMVRLLEATGTRLQDLPILINESALQWRRACRR